MAAQERASKKALLAEMDRNERVAHRETLRHQQEQELVVSSASQQSIPGESTSIASSHNNNKKVPSIKKHSSHRRAKKRAIEQQLMMRRSSTFSSADQDDSAMQQIKQEIRAEWDRERAHDSNANVWEQVLEEARIGDDEKPNPNRKKKSAPPKRMLARSISLPASASVLDKESILREMDRNDRVARTTRPKKKHRLDQEQPSQMAEMIMRSGVTLLDEHDAYGAAVDESDDDDDDYDDYDTNTDGSGAPKTQLRRLPNHRAPVLPGVTRHSFRIQTTSSLPGAYGVQDNSLQRFVSGALTPHPFHVATHHHPEDSSVRESVTLSMFDSVDDTTINNSPNKGFISRRGQQFCLYGIVGIIFLLGIGIGLGIGVSTPKSANTSGLRPPKWGDDDSNNNDTDGGEDGINGPDEKDFPIKRIQETCQYDGVQEFHRSFLTDRIVAKRDDFFQQSRIFPNDNDLPSTLSTTSCDARNLAALFAVGNGAEGSSTMNRYVLTLLYLELGGAYWDRSISWLSSTKPNGECEWQGVECASEQVIRLSLGRNGLVGDQLPSEVFSLTSLRELDLNGNEIGGTLSSEVGNLENLGKSTSLRCCCCTCAILLFKKQYYAHGLCFPTRITQLVTKQNDGITPIRAICN